MTYNLSIMKKLILLLLSFSLITASAAHSGRTDVYGGHNHYHNSGGSNSYSGNCACPYDRASDGSLCGARSAWSRSGGASPQCYSNDSSYGNNDGYIDYNFWDAYGLGQLSSYGVGQAAAYQEGYMKGGAIGNAIKIITNNSNSNNQSIPKTRRNKWSCPAGYKRDLADGCVKGFVANLNDGIDA